MTRYALRYLCLSLFAVLIPLFAYAQSITGTYSGTATIQDDPNCPNTIFTGKMSMTLIQEGMDVGGILLIEATAPDVDQNCNPEGPAETEVFGAEIIATISGNTLSGQFFSIGDDENEAGYVDFTATVSGASITGDIFDFGNTVKIGSFSVSKEPDSPFTGFWSGSYQFTPNGCPPESGTLEGHWFSFQQYVVGVMEIPSTQGGCPDNNPDVGTIVFIGIPSGNTIMGVIEFPDEGDGGPNEEEVEIHFSATLSGNTMTGTIVEQSSPSNPGGTGSFTLTRGAQLPQITRFDATQETISAGESTTLIWSTSGAQSVSINNGVGTQLTDGSISVSPTQTTTYTLTATNSGGSATASVTVNVITVPAIQLSEMPKGIVQETGHGGTDQYVLTNSGGASTTITLQTQGDTFFTQAPLTFTLAPGQSQAVTINTQPMPAGSYQAFSIPTGNGVPAGLTIPIRVLSTAPPAGVVNAVPAQFRVDVVSPPEGNPPPGTARFTNSGAATLNGILVADVPWIIPQSGIITIPAGQSVNVSFTIDRSKRPDAGSVSGTVIGTISLVFLSAPPAGKMAFNGGSVTVNSPVSVTDTAASAAGAAVIPPIAANEIAFFVPGVRHQTDGAATLVSDLGIANLLGSAPLTGVRLYYSSRSGVPPLSLLSTISSIPENQLFGAANVVKTIFGNEAQVGTAQVRASAAARLAVGATLLNTSNSAGTVGTVLPVVRSDRDVRQDGSLFLTGFRTEAGVTNDLYLQETSGQPASVQVQFFNAEGNPVGSPRNEALESFRLLQLNNVAPAGAVAARLTASNTSQGQFSAYATSSTAGGELWSFVDWSRHFGYSQASSVVIPVAGSATRRRHSATRGGAATGSAEGQVRRTDVSITNTGAGQATGTLKFYMPGGQSTEQPITLNAQQTRVLDDIVPTFFKSSGAGYIVFSPSPGGSFAVTSRSFTSTQYGSSVPVLAAGSGLKKGEVRRIISVHDASQESITARKGGTFRTDFGMIETAGAQVKVRVTLHYTYPAGNVAAVRDTASREYTLAPRQMLYFRNLAREIIGPGRESTFGDLTNLQVEFSILDGEGAVIPYTISVDNGTADAFVRVE